jgi:lysophospholipase L1-like esterase
VRHCVGVALLFMAGLAAACASPPPCAPTPANQRQDKRLADGAPKVGRRGCTEQKAAAPALPPRPAFVAVPIEDPSGHALAAFHAALRRAETKQGQAHIVFYGASHVAADVYTEIIRVRLQTRFGEAGVGFALPAKPLIHYRSAGIEFENSVGWTGVHVKVGEPSVNRFGLAGMYVVSGRKPAHSAFSTRARSGLTGRASEFELYYLKQPKGGHLSVSIDGESHEIATAAPRAKPGYQRFSLPDAEHRVELTTHRDGPVQLFGMVIERNAPGVVLDTLGIPGARAANQLLWDEALFREQLTRRNPDLVVLAYGTNEAGDDTQPIEEYAANLRAVMARVQGAAPSASCLLIGPSDRPNRDEEGNFIDRPRTMLVANVQRQVAAEHGCGFFDLIAFMGGPMSMPYWVAQDPPLAAPDHVHFTYRGYELLGTVLYDDLLAGYDAPQAKPAQPMLEPALDPRAAPARIEPLNAAPDTPQNP